jgi:hypothetical protein
MKTFDTHELNSLGRKKSEAISRGFSRLSGMLNLLVPPDDYTIIYGKLQEAFLLSLQALWKIKENQK